MLAELTCLYFRQEGFDLVHVMRIMRDKTYKVVID